jgi:hypothetical protein
MKGWLVSTSPNALPGDTTPWFASFWEFCSRYCNERFGKAWYLSPEQSLLLHAENTIVPKQVIVHSTSANNNRIDLLFGTSFFALKVNDMPSETETQRRNGLRVFRASAALVKVTESFFVQNPVEAAVILGGIRDPSEVLAHLLAGGHTTIAGRLAGAFRHIGAAAVADEIVASMRAADYTIRESDPFASDYQLPAKAHSAAPIVSRLNVMWASAREQVLEVFPSPRANVGKNEYLKLVDDVYELDAYHSLSIEGYQVTAELVQRVASGEWDPDGLSTDRESQNALAARGYWLAFQRVRDLAGNVWRESSAPNVRLGHREWYREMFSPHVAAGLLPATALAGYRNVAVFLRGSRHVPPRWELLGEAMPALFDLIEGEPEPAVRAVLGHWMFGYVHPYPDGNGRIARFLMNVLLASGGYPWTVIRVEERASYLDALESASVDNNIKPFAEFVVSQMRKTTRTARTSRGGRVSGTRRAGSTGGGRLSGTRRSRTRT